MKFGYVKDYITRDHYVLGGISSVPKIVLQPDGNWSQFVPTDEYQNIFTETYNCTGFGTLNCLETLLNRQFNSLQNYSDRFVGISAGTYPPGNSPHKVAESIRAHGLVPEFMLPFSKEIDTADKYYSPNPLLENLKQAGLLWTDLYELKHEWVDFKDIPEALTYSPLGVAVDAWTTKEGEYVRTTPNDNHWTSLYGINDKGQYMIYDSYDNSHKLLSKDYIFSAIKRYYITLKDKSADPINQRQWLTSIAEGLKAIAEIVSQLFSKKT